MNTEKTEVIVKTEKTTVKLLKPFPVIKETLERIGIANRTTKKLFPSCYILNSNGQTYVCHFKELLKVPGMTETDVKRKNTILWLLLKWGLIDIDNAGVKGEVTKNIQKKKIYILSKKQLLEENWEIVFKWHSDKGMKNTKGETK